MYGNFTHDSLTHEGASPITIPGNTIHLLFFYCVLSILYNILLVLPLNNLLPFMAILKSYNFSEAFYWYAKLKILVLTSLLLAFQLNLFFVVDKIRIEFNDFIFIILLSLYSDFEFFIFFRRIIPTEVSVFIAFKSTQNLRNVEIYLTSNTVYYLIRYLRLWYVLKYYKNISPTLSSVCPKEFISFKTCFRPNYKVLNSDTAYI